MGNSYVTGFKPEGKDGYVEVTPRATKREGTMAVTAIQSTDAGVGFLVRVDGLTIVHAGDHVKIPFGVQAPVPPAWARPCRGGPGESAVTVCLRCPPEEPHASSVD